MAGGIEITIDVPELEQIKDAFRKLPGNISAKYMAAALGKAIEPGLKALRQLTPRGPTGNLRKSISKKTKRYVKTGAGVALAGYTAPPRKKAEDLKGNEKGAHQGFLEFGTKERKTKGRIASSFKRSGPVKVVVAKRAKNIRTSPKPPKGFVKAAPAGGNVSLGAFPIGGKGGVPPVKTAFDRTSGQISSLMKKEMAIALNNATKEMASPFRAKGRR